MKILVTSDLHLTDRPQDEYRWRIFPFIRNVLRDKPCELITILGDATDRRDNHSSLLVNRMIDNLRTLRKEFATPIVILGGNHDKPFSGPAYFEFLDYIDGILYISKPTGFGNLLFLPYTQTPEADWKDFSLSKFDALFIHQAVEGVIAGNGARIEADCRVMFPRGKPIISGHIHKPQTVGAVTYVGSPYHTAFGDNFDPRILLLEDSRVIADIRTELTKKLVIQYTDLKDLTTKLANRGCRPIDQVRFVYIGESTDIQQVEREVREASLDFNRVEFGSESTASATPDQSPSARFAKDLDATEIVKRYLSINNKQAYTDLALEILAGRCNLSSAEVDEVNKAVVNSESL